MKAIALFFCLISVLAGCGRSRDSEEIKTEKPHRKAASCQHLLNTESHRTIALSFAKMRVTCDFTLQQAEELSDQLKTNGR